ncbi:hypothetical protein PNOK_0041800 [Pyrrhoderma noxium]|uniref:Cyclase n=1 Tax=Pyrrhoderma noxium TaxID=2282107 RepID=A0A286UUR5_9AGAM|nr:hypothetical protein PNOK_0041800 [Pyrrhoderma noxium]
MASSRLTAITSHLIHSSSSRKNNNDKKIWDKLPTFDELPKFRARLVKTGETVCLNWPLNFPDKPVFHRRAPHIEVMKTTPGVHWNDDEITINTQSGSQWDGLRHFGVAAHGVFYQNVKQEDIKLGKIDCSDPFKINKEDIKLGIQNWAQHGICGRAVFLDIVDFLTRSGTIPLPYDPWTSHPISVAELEACARAEGVTFKQGDILLIRMGHTKRYYESNQAEKDALPTREEIFAGIEQSEDMKRFLWNNHFAAVASDQPALERWPLPEGTPHMHQTIIGLWGMPIGEMFDLEELSKVCATKGQYTFFFTSWPLNIIGGCASPPNAAAYF